jgi:hypothetical protein
VGFPFGGTPPFFYRRQPRTRFPRAPFPYPWSSITPVIVIVIVQELELEEAVASIVVFSFNSGASANTLGSEAAKTTITIRIEAQHRSLSSVLNVLSSHLDQDASIHK